MKAEPVATACLCAQVALAFGYVHGESQNIAGPKFERVGAVGVENLLVVTLVAKELLLAEPVIPAGLINHIGSCRDLDGVLSSCGDAEGGDQSAVLRVQPVDDGKRPLAVIHLEVAALFLKVRIVIEFRSRGEVLYAVLGALLCVLKPDQRLESQLRAVKKPLLIQRLRCRIRHAVVAVEEFFKRIAVIII